MHRRQLLFHNGPLGGDGFLRGRLVLGARSIYLFILLDGDLLGRGDFVRLYQLQRRLLPSVNWTGDVHELPGRDFLRLLWNFHSIWELRGRAVLDRLCDFLHQLHLRQYRGDDRDDGLLALPTRLLPSKHGAKLVHGLPRRVLLFHE